MVEFLLGLFVGIVLSGLITLYGGFKLQQKQEKQQEQLMRTFLKDKDINELYKRYES